MKVKLWASGLILFSVCLYADPVDRVYQGDGFTIGIPSGATVRPGTASGPNNVVVYLIFPASGNFSPNINVMIQQYAETIQRYKELSEMQFVSLNFTAISSRIVNDAYYVEYTGVIGRELHFYAKAVRSGPDRVYLATGTATPEQWASYGPALKEAVDSMTVGDDQADNTGDQPPPPPPPPRK